MYIRTLNALVALSLGTEEKTVVLRTRNGVVYFDPTNKENPWSFFTVIETQLGVHPMEELLPSLEAVLRFVEFDDIYDYYSNELGAYLYLSTYQEGKLKVLQLWTQVLDLEKVMLVKGELILDLSVSDNNTVKMTKYK